MWQCTGCGFPFMLGKLIHWQDNGTITHSFRKDFRVVLIEADFLTRLLSAIEDDLGLPVRRMAFEAERMAAKAGIDADLEGPYRVLRWRPLKRFTVNLFDRMATWTGQCFSHTVDYRPGVSCEGIVRNPFDHELMAAFITGAFESLEGRPFGHTWQKRGQDEYLYIETGLPGVLPAAPITIPIVNFKPGRDSFARCARCGAPLAMRDLKWMEEEGIVMDIRKGVRMVFLDFYSTTKVLESLSQELGPGFAPIVVDTQRALFIRHIWEEFLCERRGNEPLSQHELYSQVLDTLALRGQGNPVEHALEGEKFSVTIENPFNEYLLAGFLSALYECSEGVVPEVKWERPDQQTLRFELQPAG
jgi:hypothetical protein